ncbi:GTP 3',8-cyclase MoaA [Qipengyuania sp.]|uniref:GTP 3',8-cyclase MoaA n=1 Tax=Qipengyuania sp. TaxID=2004515 RepID=UPI003736E424
MPPLQSPTALVDGFGRTIDYVRLSVTDRCNLRCTYCMAETMTFLPRHDLLTLEELALLAEHLVGRGVRRVRITGGEPLVRRGIETLFDRIGALIGAGLDELTLTTNGTRLAGMAEALQRAGVRRVNVSLDTLDPHRFAEVTRGGDLAQVLAGIEAAGAAGLGVKINAVAMKGVNEDEFGRLARWCARDGHDLAIIETMPLGETGSNRKDSYLPVSVAQDAIAGHFDLAPSRYRTGGPARYFELGDSGARVGFISPLSNNFCATCNRIRIAATGTVYGCLGHDQKVELRDIIRSGGAPALDAALDRLLSGKPERHGFDLSRPAPAVARHMSVTGG